jgi:hypothetical protein
LFKLISIRISPFCELARWVLERQGIPYREECHAPILSLPFTWMADRSLNVPVILAPDSTLDVKDFLDYIDARARATDKILPLDAGERQEAERMIVSLLTGLAITVRQYAYANMLPLCEHVAEPAGDEQFDGGASSMVGVGVRERPLPAAEVADAEGAQDHLGDD